MIGNANCSASLQQWQHEPESSSKVVMIYVAREAFMVFQVQRMLMRKEAEFSGDRNLARR